MGNPSVATAFSTMRKYRRLGSSEPIAEAHATSVSARFEATKCEEIRRCFSPAATCYPA